MASSARVVLTLLVVILWVLVLLPFTVAGVLSEIGLLLGMVVTGAILAWLWAPRSRRTP